MNHKRGKPKNARAGCLMCKPHKANGASGLKESEPIKKGMNPIRGLAHAKQDMKEAEYD